MRQMMSRRQALAGIGVAVSGLAAATACGSVAAATGTVVVATSAATGRTLWAHDTGRLLDDAKAGWMACVGGLVYVAAGETENDTAGQPTVRALDARTGRRVWEADLGAAPQVPVVAD